MSKQILVSVGVLVWRGKKKLMAGFWNLEKLSFVIPVVLLNPGEMRLTVKVLEWGYTS